MRTKCIERNYLQTQFNNFWDHIALYFQKKLTQGTNINISSNGTISATNTTYESKEGVSGGTDVSLVTTGEKYTWNSLPRNISDLDDMNLSTLSEGQMLLYNSNTNKWENKSLFPCVEYNSDFTFTISHPGGIPRTINRTLFNFDPSMISSNGFLLYGSAGISINGTPLDVAIPLSSVFIIPADIHSDITEDITINVWIARDQNVPDDYALYLHSDKTIITSDTINITGNFVILYYA